MAEDYWGNGYWGTGYWSSGYWGSGGTLPPVITPAQGGFRFHRPPQKQVNPELLQLIKEYLKLKQDDV